MKSPAKKIQTFEIITVITCLLATVSFLYRIQIENNFKVLAGDSYDAVISTTILEHWWNVIQFKSNWMQANYFHPYTKTIAQSDAYFIIGMIYSPFRLVGLDPFLSAELANIAIKSIGFIGMYALCKKAFNFNTWWATLAACVFTLSNGMTTHSSRNQLATVALAPTLTLCIWSSIISLKNEAKTKYIAYGCASAVLYGAWCMSCFYMAWFYLFLLGLFTLACISTNRKSAIELLKRATFCQKKASIIIAATAILSITPFIITFLPKSKETGVRTYSSAVRNTIPVEEIIQVGNENLLLGKIYNNALKTISPSYNPIGEYYNTGIPILLFILFSLYCINAIRKGTPQKDAILPSLSIATLASWACTINIMGHSAWFIPYHIIPGAKALNVISVNQIMLAFPVTILAIKYIQEQNLTKPISVIFSALLITEEINTPSLNLNRENEIAKISGIAPAPAECSAFYVSGWNSQGTEFPHDTYAHNVTAMMIAEKINIPTINGVASFGPPDWDFAKPHSGNYDKRMIAYAKRHNVNGLYKLDLNSKTWSQVLPKKTYNINFIDFSEQLPKGIIKEQLGLHNCEEWGTWSNGKKIILRFKKSLPKKFIFKIKAHAFSPCANKPFALTIGETSTTFILTEQSRQLEVPIENKVASETIEISIPHPTSPKALGISDDTRIIGIGIESIGIIPSA